MWAAWTPQDWVLNLVAVADGTVVGTQSLGATDFGVVREVSTASWLGLRHQGQGLGTEMRSAVLHLAFAGLATEYATSAAFLDNAASLTVSRKLGYQPDGLERMRIRSRAATQQRLRLARADWDKRRRVPVEVEGLESCIPFFGRG